MSARVGLSGELVLIRHGQTHCTRQGRFCGDHDGGLSPVGERMGGYLAEHPALAGTELLLCSPARRALATAEPIGGRTGLPVTVDDRLRELSFGAWEDRLPAEVADTPAHQRWTEDPALFTPPGGESGLAVMARAVAAVRDALEHSSRVAVVTHKAPVRLIMSFFLGLPPSRYREIAAVTVGSVTRLRLSDGRATLRAVGELDHLPPEWRADPDHIDT
ncbi:histidine phosphatase family protein [Actinokineospora sp. NBRC 105648]|uniref:histidine phosphatase family protein n=1 Tax=Actinokineospora sp. NBRC 105648 TaxID=3032206 RepID=UPI0024A13683|nr:histidine phosphatase family protein [Actinokineospora sp. NBRC 105648]GLZ37107.1 hypothetical protein Acsp05_07320 [Actinokineospora sp. NBRC 105648]